ncbi:MAG: nucleotidyltransferase domain-containing protein [Chloroflexi bacterium]|nr:nucleotidyltransferase domain-containing protein [Chloroflexota bacterium]
MIDIAAVRRNLATRAERQLAEREKRRAAAEQAVTAAARRAAPSFPSVRRVFLFGSVIRNNAFRADSDVDVAVEGLGTADYFAIWRAIEEAAPEWTVDVRDITQPSEFADRVRSTGKQIYERVDPTAEG